MLPLDYDDGAASSVTNSVFYLNCTTAGGPIATSNLYHKLEIY